MGCGHECSSLHLLVSAGLAIPELSSPHAKQICHVAASSTGQESAKHVEISSTKPHPMACPASSADPTGQEEAGPGVWNGTGVWAGAIPKDWELGIGSKRFPLGMASPGPPGV